MRHNTTAEASEQFRLFVEAVEDYAIFMLDANGRVVTWNLGAERIKGYSAPEIVGQHFSVFYTPEEQEAGRPAHALAVAATEGHYVQEGWRVRKDGTRFWASAVLTAVHDPDGNLIGFVKVTRDFTDRKEMERQLHESEESLRELSLHLLRTQEEERRRIGRDLHDSLGQYLAALKMNVEMAAARAPKDGELIKAVQLVEEAIKEVRTLSYLLHPPLLEETGLSSAIQWYLDGFSSRSNIKVSFHRDSKFPRLSRDLELAMFRVLQESLTNVHRHSGSPTAEVRLYQEGGYAVLEICDHGRGMDQKLLRRKNSTALGIGVRGMMERMRQIGGELQLKSGPNGTTVRAKAPIQRELASRS